MRLGLWIYRERRNGIRKEALRAMRAIRRTNQRNEPVAHNSASSANDLWYAAQMPTGG